MASKKRKVSDIKMLNNPLGMFFYSMYVILLQLK